MFKYLIEEDVRNNKIEFYKRILRLIFYKQIFSLWKWLNYLS